jgi:hypothetical protein
MSGKSNGGYADKHPRSAELEKALAEALQEEIREGKISCAAAHRVAKRMGRSPSEIGLALDLMEVRLTRCQLGLFGYSPQKRIVTAAAEWKPALEDDIRKVLRNGRLPCDAAWSIARRHGLSRLEVANVCEALGIKVRPCQLGAF